jgi:hypothetical protein
MPQSVAVLRRAGAPVSPVGWPLLAYNLSPEAARDVLAAAQKSVSVTLAGVSSQDTVRVSELLSSRGR